MGNGKVNRFEDLKAWQAARQLVRQIYAVTRKRGFVGDYRLSSQIQAAVISISSNISEGYERGSAAEFHKFLFIAKASCAEVRSQLYNAKDVGYLSEDDFQQLLGLSECTARLIGALREAVKRQISK
jgi:four helix bundle protein